MSLQKVLTGHTSPETAYREGKPMRYIIRSKDTGEVYVSDGTWACGPLDSSVRNAPLEDYNLDNESPDWVANKEGIIEKESN